MFGPDTGEPEPKLALDLAFPETATFGPNTDITVVIAAAEVSVTAETVGLIETPANGLADMEAGDVLLLVDPAPAIGQTVV